MPISGSPSVSIVPGAIFQRVHCLFVDARKRSLRFGVELRRLGYLPQAFPY